MAFDDSSAHSPTTSTAGGDGQAAMDLGYVVAIENFSGPLDLLLFLVRRTELDIVDIPIVTIVDQFVDTVSQWRDLDLDTAGDFILMAASLLEIKARAIAPPLDDEEAAGPDDEIIDPRSTLITSLLRYRRFKEASRLLETLEAARAPCLQRQARDIIPDEVFDDSALDLGAVDIHLLLRTYEAIFSRLNGFGPRTVVVDEIPMEQRIEQLIDALRPTLSRLLSELAGNGSTRLTAVGTVLAVLECTRQRLVEVRQEIQYGAIMVRLRDTAEIMEPPAVLPAEAPEPKRRRRMPLVTWQAPPGSDEGGDVVPDEEPQETDEQRFVRELEESSQVDSVLAQSADLEAGFLAYCTAHHPDVALLLAPPAPQAPPVSPSTPATADPHPDRPPPPPVGGDHPPGVASASEPSTDVPGAAESQAQRHPEAAAPPHSGTDQATLEHLQTMAAMASKAMPAAVDTERSDTLDLPAGGPRDLDDRTVPSPDRAAGTAPSDGQPPHPGNDASTPIRAVVTDTGDHNVVAHRGNAPPVVADEFAHADTVPIVGAEATPASPGAVDASADVLPTADTRALTPLEPSAASGTSNVAPPTLLPPIAPVVDSPTASDTEHDVPLHTVLASSPRLEPIPSTPADPVTDAPLASEAISRASGSTAVAAPTQPPLMAALVATDIPSVTDVPLTREPTASIDAATEAATGADRADDRQVGAAAVLIADASPAPASMGVIETPAAVPQFDRDASNPEQPDAAGHGTDEPPTAESAELTPALTATASQMPEAAVGMTATHSQYTDAHSPAHGDETAVSPAPPVAIAASDPSTRPLAASVAASAADTDLTHGGPSRETPDEQSELPALDDAAVAHAGSVAHRTVIDDAVVPAPVDPEPPPEDRRRPKPPDGPPPTVPAINAASPLPPPSCLPAPNRTHPAMRPTAQPTAKIIAAIAAMNLAWLAYVWLTWVPTNVLELIDTPDHLVDGRSPLCFTFNLDMVGADAQKRPPVAPPVISPAIAGTWSWRDQRTLQFAPDRDLPVATSFTVQFGTATVRSESGFRLGHDCQQQVHTEALSARDVRVESYAGDGHAIVVIDFNHAVDPAAIARQVIVRDLAGTPGTAPPAITVTARDAAPSQRVRLEIASGTRFEFAPAVIGLPQGTTGVVGTLGLAQPWQAQLHLGHALAVRSASADAPPRDDVTVHLATTPADASLTLVQESLVVLPAVPYSTHATPQGLDLVGAFAPGQDYQIDIQPRWPESPPLHPLDAYPGAGHLVVAIPARRPGLWLDESALADGQLRIRAHAVDTATIAVMATGNGQPLAISSMALSGLGDVDGMGTAIDADQLFASLPSGEYRLHIHADANPDLMTETTLLIRDQRVRPAAVLKSLVTWCVAALLDQASDDVTIRTEQITP